MPYTQFFQDAIGKLKTEQRYRVFTDIERNAERFPHAIWRDEHGAEQDITIWCSNDYLGMGVNPEVIAAMKSATSKHGAGAGGTRNISGTSHPLVKLEAELADLHGKEAALVFTSGWISNLAAISTIADLLPNCLILSDALNHNSMIEGVRRSSAERKIWRHNDVAHLEELLARTAARARQADRVREPLFDGRRHFADQGHLRPRRKIQRHDLYRRGPCGRHVWRARRRRRRTRRPDAPHRRHRGHARQGLRRHWRLYRREPGDHRRRALVRPQLHLQHGVAAGSLRRGRAIRAHRQDAAPNCAWRTSARPG